MECNKDVCMYVYFVLQKCKDPEASLVDTFARTEPPDTQVSNRQWPSSLVWSCDAYSY
jgi:hypothetical protein